jgi:hypothetical protein
MLRSFFSEASQRLTLRETGWSASFDIALGGTSRGFCHIAVGTIALPHSELTLGVPACFPEEPTPET